MTESLGGRPQPPDGVYITRKDYFIIILCCPPPPHNSNSLIFCICSDQTPRRLYRLTFNWEMFIFQIIIKALFDILNLFRVNLCKTVPAALKVDRLIGRPNHLGPVQAIQYSTPADGYAEETS